MKKTTKKARQKIGESQFRDASPAPTKLIAKPIGSLSGPPKTRKGRQLANEAQWLTATSTPAIPTVKPIVSLPGSLNSVVESIRAHHRERRFAMGIQQVLDRKLESFIRINHTGWHVGDDEATRDKSNKEVAAKIKAARAGEGDERIISIVKLTDNARQYADVERARHEKEMESLAKQLPVAAWVESVPGFGLLGLATIIAETGDLSMYANVAKVWKRLGYAPFLGLAGSSWKRPTWREGRQALSAEEWIANPFSGRRYAMIHTISVWLKNHQWIGAAKSEDGVGKPDGKYGEVYAKRRAHTAVTHEDWSKQHAHMDALRIMMKAVLKDLYLEWNPHKKILDQIRYGRQRSDEAHGNDATASPARHGVKPNQGLPGSPNHENGRHNPHEAPDAAATASPANDGTKSKSLLPGSPNSKNRKRTDRHV